MKSMIPNSADFTPLVNSRQSAELDYSAKVDYGLSTDLLMETAGALSAQKVISYLNHLDGKLLAGVRRSSFSVMVLCGPGNNGGDGLVLARHLLSEGIAVKVFLSSVKRQRSHPQNLLLESQKFRSLGITFYPLEDMQKIKQMDEKCLLIVDALFGVGLNRNIEGIYAELIKWVNSIDKPVVSLDTSSGLDVNTGQIKGQAIKADLTLTFGLAKPGFYLMQGPEHTGRIEVFSIGFPFPLLREKACTHFLIDKYWVSSHLPERKPTDHKANHGHLLVVAGSEGMWGAGALTALSAYRMGAGYVTWAVPCANDVTGKIGNIPDMLTQDLSDLDLFRNKTSVAIGPGLGTGEKTKNLLLELKKTTLPVVVDASAFLVCVKENLFPLPSHWVITPHSGELSRLFGITGKQVDQDRCSYAMKASQKTGCLVLLKGFHSVLAQSDKCWIIPAGNSSLAKAGTGDVLTGFIGALMARCLNTFSATAVASFVHGLLAEGWLAEGKDKDSLMAQDLKDILPVVLKKLKKLSK